MFHQSFFPFPFSRRQLLQMVTLFAAAALAAAFIAQYVFLLHPCELCIFQRYPYALIVLMGVLSLWRVRAQKALGYAILICVALLLIDGGIAFYHSGVELGWFPAPDACSSDAPSGQTLEEMRAAIMNAPLVTCAQAMAHVFGLSMAAWNAIAAWSMALFCLYGLRKAA